MKSSFCIDLQRFMLIPTKFPLSLQNICETTNFFMNYFLSRTGVMIVPNGVNANNGCVLKLKLKSKDGNVAGVIACDM